MHYILFYKVVDNFIEKRAMYRDDHLKLVREAHTQGNLVMAGALAEPANEAVLVFKGDTPKIAEDFALSDPYVKNGLITNWEIRPWNVVVGGA